ncbi:hypothetical protein ANO11243_004520 [Dothideomycetidae sp. 11243]|nr:hypothetical protein ANO11243_004520 [fungal sp. No.11243]
MEERQEVQKHHQVRERQAAESMKRCSACNAMRAVRGGGIGSRREVWRIKTREFRDRPPHLRPEVSPCRVDRSGVQRNRRTISCVLLALMRPPAARPLVPLPGSIAYSALLLEIPNSAAARTATVFCCLRQDKEFRESRLHIATQQRTARDKVNPTNGVRKSQHVRKSILSSLF